MWKNKITAMLIRPLLDQRYCILIKVRKLHLLNYKHIQYFSCLLAHSQLTISKGSATPTPEYYCATMFGCIPAPTPDD